MFDQPRLDFSRLQTQATQLDLEVVATEEFQFAVIVVARQIPVRYSRSPAQTGCR
jgi:hypothetical protein